MNKSVETTRARVVTGRQHRHYALGRVWRAAVSSVKMKQDAPPMQSSEDEREQNALTKAIHDEELSEARKAQEKYRDLSLEGRQSALPTLFLSCRPKKSKRKTTGLKKKETNILERKSRLFGSKSGYKTTGCPLKGGIDNSKTAAQKCNVRSENDESALHELKAASAAKALEDNKNDFGCNHSFLNHDEIDSFVGKLWRTLLMYILLISFDVMNALRLTRPLQLSLPFLTAHEAYLVAQVIEAFDTGKQEEIRYALSLAFMNRNVSRLLLQNIRLRYDFLWHWHTMITWNRLFDGWGQFPIIGITSFPPTENFPSTRNHALASIFRLVLGPGNWPTRVFTGGREGLLTDTPENVAQNLAAESNGFEFANRNQYGTYIGRRKLNEFRKAHRLPTDESIVRTFVAQPTSTMLNNGVFHTIRQLANHWHNTLNEPCGNFSHQRMEQLDPFETLRFHMPEVLLVLSSLRGRNSWDAMVLGPMVKKLQSLSPSATTESAKQVVRELQTTIVVPVCAGIPSLVNPFRRWLDAIHKACVLIDKEAQKIFKLVSACRPGIRVGYNLVSRVNWRLPSDQNLKKMILDYIDGKSLPKRTKLRVQSALQLTTPRDKRTLIELAQKNLSETKSAKLLIGRVKTLLQREYRRELLNKAIRQMSKGKAVVHFLDGEWYWLEGQGSASTVFAYDKEGGTSEYHRFVQLSSGKEKLISKFDETIQFRQYIAVGECIRYVAAKLWP